MTASAVGDRQMLPRHTKQTRITRRVYARLSYSGTTGPPRISAAEALRSVASMKSPRSRSLAGWALVVGGCSFDPSGSRLTGGIDASSQPPDASLDGQPPLIDAELVADAGPDAAPPDASVPIITDDVAHVLVADEYGGATADADLVLGAATTIDTTNLTITGVTLPEGVVFAAATQDSLTPGAPELAILHVDDLTITAAIRLVGTRPFVVVASGTITISADLDAGAHRTEPGAGGALPGMGPAPGLPGQHAGSTSDSGGGGGGYATAGGQGGDGQCGAGCGDAIGGAGGGILSTSAINTLRGGSGGGAASASGVCVYPEAGAGGGSVQLYAAISIAVSAAIHVGGGGGGQGEQCPGNMSSASGGGSAGSIYLQTPTATLTGALYANGGGGGGSAGFTNDGTPGDDGGAATSTAGGANGGSYGSDGGDGGGAAIDAEPGVDGPNDGNGGGGGGAEGRIAIRTKIALTGTPTASPAANVALY